MQANSPATALCPGTQCRTVYDNFLNSCDDVPDVMDTVHQTLAAFDQVGKYYYSY